MDTTHMKEPIYREPKWSLKQVARRLSVTETILQRWIAKGSLRVEQSTGGRVVVPESAVMEVFSEYLASPVEKHIGVYFIFSDRFIKIGYASHMPSRVGTIASGLPCPVEVLAKIRTKTTEAAKALEARFHQQFAEHRQRGEWFRDVPEIREFIATLQPPGKTEPDDR